MPVRMCPVLIVVEISVPSFLTLVVFSFVELAGGNLHRCMSNGYNFDIT
jgi:hypothetical protein